MRHGILLGLLLSGSVFAAELPISLDLRNMNGDNFVSAVKSQSGGTCWTHATMASIESDLMVSGTWAAQQELGEPNLAEYHLDWWNGFNRNFNSDASDSHGLTVHQGGDYLVATAYLARGGAVRDIDGQSYGSAPTHHHATYHHYYPRHAEWLVDTTPEGSIRRIKDAVSTNGVVGTALAWSNSFFDSSNSTFYQPPTSTMGANHAVSIVGWDDRKKTDAKDRGAWLIKNSWGTSWGEGGYFWISYYDKFAGHDEFMGAVSFRDVEPLSYDKIYSLDLHGWRATKAGANSAFNVFTASAQSEHAGKNESLKAVSFFTTAHDSGYTVHVYSTFENGELKNEIANASGHESNRGFHTVDLTSPVSLSPGQKFFVQVELPKGGHAFDKTSEVPVLLCGGNEKVIVKSRAQAGESFYLKNGVWTDLTQDESSGNFAIKALSVFN